MFVLVRNDLSKSQQGVQGGHALAQFALDWPDSFKKWNNRTIVYLKTDYETLCNHFNKVVDGHNVASDFYEPDIGDQLTAIAAFGPTAEDYFANFKLM
jgi:hypothetical protein